MIRRLVWPALYLAFFCLFSWHLGGDGSPDQRAYHLYNGYAAMSGGRPQDIAPAGLQTYFYPGLDALYYRLLRALNNHPGGLSALLGIPYALAAVCVWRTGAAIVPRSWPGREALAGAAALFGLTGAAGFATLGTTMSEVVPGLPLLGAIALWVRRPGDLRLLGLAGLLAGLSVGLKLTELPVFLGLFVAVLASGMRRPGLALAQGAVFGAAGLCAALAVAGPWLVHNWQLTGNPVFPAYNDLFRSDLVDPGRWTDDRFKPHGLWHVLFYPAYWAFRESHAAIELNMHDPRMLAELAAIVLLLVRRAALPEARLLALAMLVAYALWEFEFGIYRYLTAPEALSGALILAALAAWVPRRAAVPASLALVVAGAAAAATTKYPWWDRALPARQAIVVNLPPIPPNALVVFLDRSALAYTIPFMPPSVTVIGADTNLVHPGSSGRLQARIAATIEHWQGPIWGFENGRNFPGLAAATLRFYGLRRAGGCQAITSNLEAEAGTACPLARASP